MTDDKGLANVAFQNASDGSIVLVMVNSNVKAFPVSVVQGDTRFEYTMPPESVATFVWNTGQAEAWRQRVLEWLNKIR